MTLLLARQRRSHLIARASLERRLDPCRFARIHRGVIVRIDQIRDLTPHPSGEYTIPPARWRAGGLGPHYRARLSALARGTWRAH